MLIYIFLTALLVFIIAYRIYGRYLDKTFDVNCNNPTPSHTDFDGVDRVPAKAPVLLGHHFSSIAGAGPIVGPIIAGIAFGWLPALLWIVLGTIFIGGIHDYTSLMASIRHKAKSIGEIARIHMSPLAYRMFLIFIWLALVFIASYYGRNFKNLEFDLDWVLLNSKHHPCLGLAAAKGLFIFISIICFFAWRLYRYPNWWI
jgi:carbon starvation protein